MQRKPFWKLLLAGLGYMVLGNLMSAIMTIAASVVANIAAIMVILFILTLFVFYSLCFTVAFKDGQHERLLVKNHRVESASSKRWTLAGFIMLGVMLIPSILLFIDARVRLFDGFLIPYRMICGMIYPLSLAMGVNYADIELLPDFYPLIFAACYVLIPLATTLGFVFGFEDKFNPDKFMYEKK